MSRFIDADALIDYLGIREATKYGNKNSEQQSVSYGTLMNYEILNAIEDQPTVVVPDMNVGSKFPEWRDPELDPPEVDPIAECSDYILLSFTDMTDPLIGRCENSYDGGAYYIGDDNESTYIACGLIVDGWMELPKNRTRREGDGL